jgi:two-component system chemotaxis sensor kinase CheA
MLLFDRLRVGSKLVLLAGLPVLGTLLLSTLVVLEVQKRAEAAAGLGSIEDLAQLTEKMLHVIDDLQWERAEVTFSAANGWSRPGAVKERQRHTDEALNELTEFLSMRDAAQLPTKLRQDLSGVRAQLLTLPEMRLHAETEQFEILEYLAFFSKANDSLIGATAALTQLSNDKQLLLSIGSLVSAMQVIERNAREHALLNYVIGKQEFPPGTFRYLVTLLTEQEVYTESLHTWASDEEFARLKKALKGPMAEQIANMRQLALETTEGELPIEPRQWAEAQNENLAALVRMEHEMAGTVRAVVADKMSATRSAVRLAMGLVAGVVGLSLLIGWAITRSLTRSVRVLSLAAEAVHKNNDFGIRAEKTSSDELGLLTDAFNGMLAGIQERDSELLTHRQNLEALVEARTLQLSQRNEEMRLVLDNIDQGLAMIDRDGRFLGECSRTFRETFGAPEPGTPFFAALARDDLARSFELELGYEQLIADVLPVELALEQMPRSVVHQQRHHSLSFTRVMHGAQPAGALLVTRDVTHEMRARRAETEQRERVQIFERLMRDRAGFQEFMLEARELVARVSLDPTADRTDTMRVLHTLKGSAAVFDVTSVAEAAHDLEQVIVQEETTAFPAALSRLHDSWEAFLALVVPLLDESGQRIEITPEELEQLAVTVREHAAHALILRSLRRFTREPVRLRFQRIEDQLKRVAQRLKKPVPMVVIDARDVRLPARKFRQFWSSLTHMVRNIVDHGLEPESERIAGGKARQNRIELSARSDATGLCIELADDGQGIHWERLAEKAREHGLGAETRAELIQALFADGVSTAPVVSQTSGRGVGMSAVQAACLALGGVISVESERGRGTRFLFNFPALTEDELDSGVALSDAPRSAANDAVHAAVFGSDYPARPSRAAN